MKTSTKIAIAVALGVGGYMLFFRPKKAKSGEVSDSSSDGMTPIVPETKEEKIQYILENAEANSVETKTGFDGVKMTWNPKLGKMYPIGTLSVEQMPDYAEAVFSSAEGSKNEDPVEKAYVMLDKLTDSEIELAYLVTKFRKDNPKAVSEADAIKEMGADEKSKALLVIKSKVTPVLNDVKLLKKTPNWTKGSLAEKLAKVKEKVALMKAKHDEKNKTRGGASKKPTSVGSMQKARPTGGANPRAMVHAQKKSSFLGNLDGNVMTKAEINDMRQKGFINQVVNRTDAGMYGGRRWDGKNFDQVETVYLGK